MSSPTPAAESATSAPTSTTAATTASTTPASIPTSYKSLSDFQKKNPKMYELFVLGIAESMIPQLKKSADRVIQEMKKQRQNNS